MRATVKIFLSICALLCLTTHDGIFTLEAQATERQSIDTVSAKKLKEIIDPHTGKVLLLNFFASWCPPCRKEIPGLMAIREKYGANNVYILGISIDHSMSDLKNFVKKMDINYPVVRVGSDVTQLFEIRSIPHNILVDKDDNIIIDESGFVSEKELTRLINELLESK